MTHQFVNSVDRTLEPGLASSVITPIASHTGAVPETRQLLTILDQIEELLQVLSAAVNNPLAQHSGSASALLAPHQLDARQIEVAMHQLRQRGWARSSAATELSQSLTVVVLLIDLLVSGQIEEAHMLDSYDLLHRNISRATGCIATLRM